MFVKSNFYALQKTTKYSQNIVFSVEEGKALTSVLTATKRNQDGAVSVIIVGIAGKIPLAKMTTANDRIVVYFEEATFVALVMAMHFERHSSSFGK